MTTSKNITMITSPPKRPYHPLMAGTIHSSPWDPKYSIIAFFSSCSYHTYLIYLPIKGAPVVDYPMEKEYTGVERINLSDVIWKNIGVYRIDFDVLRKKLICMMLTPCSNFREKRKKFSLTHQSRRSVEGFRQIITKHHNLVRSCV